MFQCTDAPSGVVLQLLTMFGKETPGLSLSHYKDGKHRAITAHGNWSLGPWKWKHEIGNGAYYVDGDIVYGTKLVVTPGQQHMGVGTSIVQAAEAFVCQHGNPTKFTASIYPKTAKFYQKLGYTTEITGRHVWTARKVPNCKEILKAYTGAMLPSPTDSSL